MSENQILNLNAYFDIGQRVTLRADNGEVEHGRILEVMKSSRRKNDVEILIEYHRRVFPSGRVCQIRREDIITIKHGKEKG